MGSTVVNHMLYADDVVLFSPSAKGLQKLLDFSHTYGCNHDCDDVDNGLDNTCDVEEAISKS